MKAKHDQKYEFSNERGINICIYEAIIQKSLLSKCCMDMICGQCEHKWHDNLAGKLYWYQKIRLSFAQKKPKNTPKKKGKPKPNKIKPP